MKKLMSLLLVLLLVFALAACGGGEANKPTEPAKTEAEKTTEAVQDDSDLAYVQSNKKMIIGYTDYAPMNYYDDNGDFTGFDTELAIEVCERLGVEPDFVEINWDTKQVELEAKSIDCIWNGMTILPELSEALEITQPYVKNAQVVIVKEGTAYDGTASLIGMEVAAEQGSAGEKAIVADDDLKQANLVPKSLQTEALMEVKAGTVDAAVLDLTLAKTMTGPGTNYEDIVIVDHLAEENYGVAFRKGSDICAEVNKIFDELIADGTMGALADKYGLDLAD
ncbi:MAG: transporter substrate-binding domain-containing protein [Clostridiaceae bacterium]|jgi:polar amino acid transport system substrate-binding protein|nr:transporter substrate-binding domain-containing protein [Clostridiaceae bacterium]HZJ90966.1 transporter substrate-binding domain-containing protein [Oscillospiraceae bacterium]